MTADVTQARVLGWSNRLLGARTLAALSEALAEAPACPDEQLSGRLVLADARQELRLLAAGDSGSVQALQGLHFVDALAGVAPGLTAMHSPWAGAYQAADHSLLFDEARGLTHVLLLPLPPGLALTGLYAIGSRGAPAALAALEPRWLEHVAGQALASAERLFHRARLLRAGVVDPLTGWNSRHYFHARLREQVATCLRRDEPASCLVLDVDGLGDLNESQGVAVGDAILLEVGTRLESQVRGSDSFAHLGDDEFAVLLPATPPHAATALAERVLATMRANPHSVGSVGVPLRVSMGIAGLDASRLGRAPERKAVADHWLAEARAALHQAKRAGGDRYSISSAGAASASGR